MHELAICRGLLRQIGKVARANVAANGAVAVERVRLKIGELSGVEPALLERAFEVARFGTIAEHAELEITLAPVVVQCRECGVRSRVSANRLSCPACGEWRVNVLEGEELLLQSIDIEETPEESEHV